jgi:hypothetical protein
MAALKEFGKEGFGKDKEAVAELSVVRLLLFLMVQRFVLCIVE